MPWRKGMTKDSCTHHGSQETKREVKRGKITSLWGTPLETSLLIQTRPPPPTFYHLVITPSHYIFIKGSIHWLTQIMESNHFPNSNQALEVWAFRRNQNMGLIPLKVKSRIQQILYICIHSSIIRSNQMLGTISVHHRWIKCGTYIEYDWVLRGRRCWHRLQYGWILKTFYSLKYAKHVSFCLWRGMLSGDGQLWDLQNNVSDFNVTELIVQVKMADVVNFMLCILYCTKISF